MKALISPRAMRDCEQNYFQSSAVRSIDVMERAAQALADDISAQLPEGASILFACGTGGNGGDGTACARLLSGRYRCTIVQPRPPRTPDAIENLRRARECGIPILSADSIASEATARPDAWVDALFGTGLTRAPSGPEAAPIRRINADRLRGARVYAADIPSGLNGQTGRAFPDCVHAHRTVTFQFLKSGLVLADGLDVCGEVAVRDVGFPPEAFPEDVFDARLIEPEDLPRLLPTRPRNVHKGSCGHLLIVAGSFGMAGAAALCARAALRSGAGLVTIACAQSIVPILQTLAPGAMCIPLEERDGAIAPGACPALEDALKGKSAVVIGCGLSRRAAVETVGTVLASGLPAVVDADALNLLAAHREMQALLRPHHVITPHPGEAARLMDRLDTGDPIGAARALNDLGATVLYKGASTVVCAPGESVFVSASGCCGMARGGSGDILSGILGALLADPMLTQPGLCAALASELHGLAGERAQSRYGSRSMNAADILEFLPEVFPG